MKRGYCPFCEGKLRYEKDTSKMENMILRGWKCKQCGAKGVEHIYHDVLEGPKKEVDYCGNTSR